MRFIAATCSLKMAGIKFEARQWSAALQHADAALNFLKLLRAKPAVDGMLTQDFALLPAVSPECGALPSSTSVVAAHCRMMCCNAVLQIGWIMFSLFGPLPLQSLIKACL